MEGLIKQAGLFLKKGVSLIFILTNPFQCCLSLGVWCVYVHVLFIYTISLSFICVSQEEPRGVGWKLQESGRGVGQNLKKRGGRQYRGSCLTKIGWLAPLYQLCKVFHPPHYNPPPLSHSQIPPISSKNFPSPHYSQSHPLPLYEEGWGVRIMLSLCLTNILSSLFGLHRNLFLYH